MTYSMHNNVNTLLLIYSNQEESRFQQLIVNLSAEERYFFNNKWSEKFGPIGAEFFQENIFTMRFHIEKTSESMLY